MTTWVLWITLISGEKISAGQYQTEDRCYQAAQIQRPFWLKYKPKVRRMDCAAGEIWMPEVEEDRR